MSINGATEVVEQQNEIYTAENTPDDAEDYKWIWGDGQTTRAGSDFASHSYSRPGTYTIELEARRGDGVLLDQATLTVEVIGDPTTLGNSYQIPSMSDAASFED